MKTSITYLGLDIAKLTLDLSPQPGLAHRTIANQASGHRKLIKALRTLPGLIHLICEATGGYEHDLLIALHQAQIPFTLVNPRQVRDFARASGLLAKTDRLDAALLAEYGRVFQPAATPARTQIQERLRALVIRRQELLGLLTQEQLRAEHHHDSFVCRHARGLKRTLQKHLDQIETEIAVLEESDATLHAQVERLSAIQGVGQRTAWLLLAALPDHGRPLARTALYMAALVAARCNPILRPLYQRLRLAGKPAKVALVALMRKLVELANLLLKNPQLALSN